MLRKKILLFLAAGSVLAAAVWFAYVNTSSSKPVEGQTFSMGTIITQRLYGSNAKKAIEEANIKIKEIENKMTINNSGGLINKLNDMSAEHNGEWNVLDNETVYVLEKAKKYSELSGGAFDVTVGPLVKAWGIISGNPRIPPADEINRLLKLVDYKSISIQGSSAKLILPGQIADLGGIAKGYAGDAVLDIYRKNGIKSAFVNLGGNVVALGKKPDGSTWKIGIQNPRAENGKYLGIVSVSDKAVVSSGDYERFFERDGKRYHHILDPKTGYPADSGLIATTIVCGLSVDADALSTASFVLGLERGMKLVESIGEVEAIFITKDKKLYTTKGLKDIFTFSDESKEFEYVEKR